MKGAIIYDPMSLVKNKFFAEKLQLELAALGAETDILTAYDGRKLDFAVMRIYDENLSRKLELVGTRVFNNSYVAEICNDKWKTFLTLSEAGLPVAPTEKAEEATMSFPRIVKARHGHGGSEVFWTNNQAEFDAVRAKLTDPAIAQPPTGKRGRDVRVYVIGNKPIIAMIRESDVDFRSNFSLGGKARVYELTDADKKLVQKVASLFSFDFAGIDFLVGEDGLICNEIEDVVGCRMVYTYTDVDIIKKYATYIVSSLKMLDIHAKKG